MRNMRNDRYTYACVDGRKSTKCIQLFDVVV